MRSDRSAWYDRVNVSALSEEVKRSILSALRDKLGYIGTCKALGIAKSSLSRYLSGEREVPEKVVKEALKHLSESEFENIVSGWDRLRALGIVKDGGTIDYGLALRIIALASRDEYLKNALLKFVVREFKEEVRKMLGLSFAGVKLEWDEGFELFLTERKRRRKVRNQETLKYYKSLFEKYLQGKELSEELIDYVVNHPSKWLRNVFRHYVQYLYFKRRISPEAFGWIMEIVPSRSYRLDVRPYPIRWEEVRRTFSFLRERHRIYYAVYRIMLESGARFTHVLKMAEAWNPGEVVEIPGLALPTRRLVVFEDKGFCRYYLGLRSYGKPCEWVYFSLKSLRLLEDFAPRHINRHQVRKYARRNGLILPKYVRKVAWRLMVKSLGREVARFLQSRFGELKISEARYGDLLSEADEVYPKYLESLSSLFIAIYV